MEDRARERRASVSVMLRVLLAQAGIGLVLATLFWGFMGRVEGYSALLGSLACVLPNAFLATRLAVPMTDARAVLRAAWLGEIGKIALTVVMFIVIMSLVRPLQFLPLFTGYIASQLMTFIAAFLTTEDGTGTDGS